MKGEGQMQRGRLTVYYGPMFGRKTAFLAEDAKSLSAIAKRNVLAFMPHIDTRRSATEIVSLSGARAPAIQVRSPFEILRMAIREGAQEVLIDEVQFFQQRVTRNRVRDWSLVFVVKELLLRGVNVHVAGLNTTFLGHPFHPTADLMAFADDLIRLRAICTVCGDVADWSLRLVDGQPVGPGGQLIVVAGGRGEEGKGEETYEARCSLHHPFL